MKAERVQAVFFDAVGTLIHPVPSATTAYAEIGARFGSRLGFDAIRQGFLEAFAREDLRDREKHWQTNETRERERWRSIVSEVLHDVADREACFAALYAHFSMATNWRCDPAADGVLRTLMQMGCRVGIASNFDHRLRSVLRGFADLAHVEPVIISSEVGWRKPAAKFFETLSSAAATPPSALLYVGDDFLNDHEGARNAGCRSVLVVPRGPMPAGARCVRRLEEVLALALETPLEARG